jgi:hypothetical protein
VIVSSGGDVAALSAKAATSSIPIVVVSGTDPVKAGLVASFNRPGGNITGASFVATELETKRLEILHDAGDWDTHQPDQSGRLDTGREIGGKRLQILKEAVPSISKVALLDLNTPNYERQFAQPLLVRRLRNFGQRDKLKANRSKGA